MLVQPKITYNDVVIDNVLPLYETVNVEGRGISGLDVDLIEIEGKDGDYLNNISIPPKNITVHFLIKANKSSEYISTLRKLNKILNIKNTVRFSFLDEAGYREGILTEVTNPPFDYFQGVGSFTIHCLEPYLYLEENKEALVSPKVIQRDNNYAVRIEKIEFIAKSQSVKFEDISNHNIIELNELNIDDNIEITKEYIKVNNQIVNNKLNWKISNWKSFFYAYKWVSVKTTGSIENAFITSRGLIL